MEIIWHYTSVYHLRIILKDQTLKVSETEKRFGVRPGLWFSKNSIWEPSASKMITVGRWMTQEEQYNAVGIVRFGVQFSNRLVQWRHYRKHSGLPSKLFKLMEMSARRKGADPKDWYCCFENIPANEWLTVEQFNGENWVPMKIAVPRRKIILSRTSKPFYHNKPDL